MRLLQQQVHPLLDLGGELCGRQRLEPREEVVGRLVALQPHVRHPVAQLLADGGTGGGGARVDRGEVDGDDRKKKEGAPQKTVRRVGVTEEAQGTTGAARHGER